MNKREAKAWLAFQKAVTKACDTLESRLSPQNRGWAEVYASGACRNAANGVGYGSAPIAEAEALVIEEEMAR